MRNGIIPDTYLWVFVISVLDKIFGPFRATAAPREDMVTHGALLQFTAQESFSKYDGGSCKPEDIGDHFNAWKGRCFRTGCVGNVPKFETALGLFQGASLASQPGAAAAATGHPAADGGGGTASGGGGTDAQVIDLTRKISALEDQIEEFEERNANLEESLQSSNFKLSSLLTHFKQCAVSLPSF